jgi:hypothetical protein
MTDLEWLQCADPELMIAFLLKKRNRKMRLAAIASCRLFSDSLLDKRSEQALEVAERFADHRATEAEREAARDNAWAVVVAMGEAYHGAVEAPGPTSEEDESFDDAHDVARAVWYAVSDEPEQAISALPSVRLEVYFSHIATILRDVYAPTTRMAFNPCWLTSTVTDLANIIYEERKFDLMPVLADALEDGGCTDAHILEHCRLANDHYRLGLHWRGCWVLDLLLGRS